MQKWENAKDILAVLTAKELKVRYKSNVLGYLWSLINPLAFTLIFYLVFGVFMQMKVPNYPIFLITGLFPWQWLSNSLGVAPHVFLGNATIIKKVRFPRFLLPLAVSLQDAFHFLMTIPVIVLFLVVYHQHPSWNWIVGLPYLLAVQLLMVFGLTLVISTLNLFFRDLERIVALLITFSFYLTPVIFSEEMIPAKYIPFIKLNPFAPLMISWRSLLLKGEIRGTYFALAGFYSLVFFGLGCWTYRRGAPRFAEVL